MTAPTAQELYDLAVDDDEVAARLRARDVLVTVTLGYSCGCTTRRSPPTRPVEVVHPGRVVICDRHDDYAVLTRVTTRLYEPGAHR